MKHDQIVEIGAKWLKRHHGNVQIPNCSIIATDLMTLEKERPDVIGWCSGRSIMIEVKTSRADFHKDQQKLFRKAPWIGVGDYRYYLCPEGLINEFELPKDWGLLYLKNKNKIEVIKFAEHQQYNQEAERNMLISLLRRKKS